jgi:ribosome biogenesis GTPase / thiamine phosphate phosphatase
MKNINMISYGYTDFFREQVEISTTEDKELIPARITEMHKEQYVIVTEFGENSAKLKGSLFYNNYAKNVYPSVGDFALVKHNPCGDDIIYRVLERKSKFSRLDSFYENEQVVATNFDYVFIMTSLNHDFNIKRIERYLTAAWQSGADPVILLTKSDLSSDCSIYREKIEQIAPEVPILAVSSHTGDGLDELKDYIKPCTTVVFLGSSGVGKSSLVNAVAGENIMNVKGIREDDSKGRHTTTHRQLIMLSNGAMIIDTPGMRELGMWDVSDGLEVAFSEIEALSLKCRFRDCSHHREPGCAVRAALESGELSGDRWDNYLKLKREARFAEQRESVNARLKEKARQKNIEKFKKGLTKKKAKKLDCI